MIYVEKRADMGGGERLLCQGHGGSGGSEQ